MVGTDVFSLQIYPQLPGARLWYPSPPPLPSSLPAPLFYPFFTMMWQSRLGSLPRFSSRFNVVGYGPSCSEICHTSSFAHFTAMVYQKYNSTLKHCQVYRPIISWYIVIIVIIIIIRSRRHSTSPLRQPGVSVHDVEPWTIQHGCWRLCRRRWWSTVSTSSADDQGVDASRGWGKIEPVGLHVCCRSLW